MTKDEALKMAIEYIERCVKGELSFDGLSNIAVLNACKEALEQPAKEPVNEQKTWRHDCKVMGYGWTTWENGCRHCGQLAPEWFNKH